MSRTITRAIDDLVALLFPRLCLACDETLPYEEPFLCLNCQLELPETEFHLQQKNAFTERFEGRLHVETAAALFFFTKQSKTQHLIHQIKYRDKREAAVMLGRMLGTRMATSPFYQAIDLIIPVPMHPRKQLQRGYNQADFIAKGIGEAMNVPVFSNILLKTRQTETQTHKSRLDRLKSVEDAFILNSFDLISGKNILIVDDVMTTGATLESCAAAILAHKKDVKISFATIAFAR